MPATSVPSSGGRPCRAKPLVLHVRHGRQLGRGDVVIARPAHKRAQRRKRPSFRPTAVFGTRGIFQPAGRQAASSTSSKGAVRPQNVLCGSCTGLRCKQPTKPVSASQIHRNTRRCGQTGAAGFARAVSPRWTGLARHQDGCKLPVAGFWTTQFGSGSSLLSWVSQKACTLAGPSQSRVSSG